MNKEELRKKGLTARSNLSLEDQTENSFQIMKKLFALKEFKNAKTIAFFVGVKTEVLTEPMIQESLMQKKIIVLPVANMKEKTMYFSEIESLEELEENEFGLFEPSHGNEFLLEEIEIIIVPM